MALRLVEPQEAPPIAPHLHPASSTARGSAAADPLAAASKGKKHAPPLPRPVVKPAAAKSVVATRSPAKAAPSRKTDPTPDAPPQPPSSPSMEIDSEPVYLPGSGYGMLSEYLGTAAGASTDPLSGHFPATGPMYVLRKVVGRQIRGPPLFPLTDRIPSSVRPLPPPRRALLRISLRRVLRDALRQLQEGSDSLHVLRCIRP